MSTSQHSQTHSTPHARFLSEDVCKALAERMQGFTKGGGETRIVITNQWRANVRYARNRIVSSGDTQTVQVQVYRGIRGAWGSCRINEIDETSLKTAVQHAERAAKYEREPVPYASEPLIDQPHLRPDIWSDRTFQLDAKSRVATINGLMDMAEREGLFSAGYAQIAANGIAVMHSTGLWRYYPHTTAQYSVTVRDPKGTASGWAGVDWNDWDRIDTKQLCQTAVEKCQQSRNSVRVEPGRYTTILEPQAVCDLLYSIVHPFPQNIERAAAENGGKPFSGIKSGTSKIGLPVVDTRIEMGADPMHPDCGFVPFTANGVPYRPVRWIQEGVLRELAYDRQYAIANFHSREALPNSGALYVKGKDTPTSIEEMIKTTRRGLLVTRFHEVSSIDPVSMLSSGYTRDGVWLIENGKISKPVKNLRFVDSPLLAFNNIEQIGEPQRVFHPDFPVVVPAVKVRDFNFASMSDAV